MPWRSHDLDHNQTNYPLALFHSFVKNSLRFNMGIIFLTYELMEATRGQKRPFEAKNGMKELILKILIFNGRCSVTSKTP